MVKISPSLTIDLKDGQKITIGIDEARQIIKDLAKFVDEGHGKKAVTRKKVQKGRSLSIKKKKLHMSDAKRKEILQHVNKQLSARPKTLSNLLKGISYVPNYLPHIRAMVEGQQKVAKKILGKRTLYYRR
jgi:CTP-dependent riboflavin kinase